MRALARGCSSAHRQLCDLVMVNDLNIVRFRHWGLQRSIDGLSPQADDDKGNKSRSRSTQSLADDRAAVTSDCSAAGMLPERRWWCKLPGMPPTKVGKLAPVTLGHMRSQGCRDLLVYCNSDRCNHSTIMNVGHLPDHTLIKSLGVGVVCTQCGHVGAHVVPNWPSDAATH